MASTSTAGANSLVKAELAGQAVLAGLARLAELAGLAELAKLKGVRKGSRAWPPPECQRSTAIGTWEEPNVPTRYP